MIIMVMMPMVVKLTKKTARCVHMIHTLRTCARGLGLYGFGGVGFGYSAPNSELLTMCLELQTACAHVFFKNFRPRPAV